VCEPYVLWLGSDRDRDTRLVTQCRWESQQCTASLPTHPYPRCTSSTRRHTFWRDANPEKRGVFFTLVRAGALRPKGGKAHRRSEETHLQDLEHELSTQRLSVSAS
jgi:hypothetical protein